MFFHKNYNSATYMENQTEFHRMFICKLGIFAAAATSVGGLGYVGVQILSPIPMAYLHEVTTAQQKGIADPTCEIRLANANPMKISHMQVHSISLESKSGKHVSFESLFGGRLKESQVSVSQSIQDFSTISEDQKACFVLRQNEMRLATFRPENSNSMHWPDEIRKLLADEKVVLRVTYTKPWSFWETTEELNII